MDIHKPKAPHSWGELAREVGTIVIGILIALSLEEALRILHDRHLAGEAREAIRAEVAQNLTFMQGRVETQACVSRRLDEVAALLARAGEGALSPAPKWVGQPSIWFMQNQRWQAATGAGRTSLLGQAEQGRYARVYAETATFAAQEDREQDAWAQLRGLESWTGPLGAAGRVHFTQALQQARYDLWSTNVTMTLALQAGRELGIRPDRPQSMRAGPTGVPHAVCLPMDTPRDQAVRQLPGFDQPR